MPSRRNAFVAIADPTRREILVLLRDQGPLLAGEIAMNFGDASRPGISRHLRVLKECGVVSAERSGKTQNYSLCPAPLVEIREEWFGGFSDHAIESLSHLRRHAESGKRSKHAPARRKNE